MDRSACGKWLKWFLPPILSAAVLCGSANVAWAQSVEELQKKIEALEEKLKAFEILKRQFEALREQMRALQRQHEVQRAKVEEQGKAAGAVAELEKTLEEATKVKISGNATGVVQSTGGVDRSLGGDESFATGSFDLVFAYKPMGNVKLSLDLEGIGGDGPEGRFPTLSGLNDDAGSAEDNVTVLEAWVEATFLDERLTVTAGKIDLTNYVDANAFANDETSQFLSSAFVNNAVLSAPDNAAGARGRLEVVTGLLYVEAGVMNQDADGDGRSTDKLFDRVYGIWEVGVTPKLFGRQGNYRFWGFADGNGREITRSGRSRAYTALGAGVSLDQEIADWLGVFFRLGYRDSANLNYATQAAWSVGLRLSNFLPFRKNDVLGVAYGEIRPTKRSVRPAPVEDEGLIEAYYRLVFTEGFHLSPLFQYVMNRGGDDRADDFFVFGTRLQVDF